MKKLRVAILSVIAVMICMLLVACGKGTGKTKKLIFSIQEFQPVN